jgi:hypothetical protein
MDDVHRLVKDLNQGKHSYLIVVHGWKRSLTITAGKPCGLNGRLADPSTQLSRQSIGQPLLEI